MNFKPFPHLSLLLVAMILSLANPQSSLADGNVDCVSWVFTSAEEIVPLQQHQDEVQNLQKNFSDFGVDFYTPEPATKPRLLFVVFDRQLQLQNADEFSARMSDYTGHINSLTGFKMFCAMLAPQPQPHIIGSN